MSQAEIPSEHAARVKKHARTTRDALLERWARVGPAFIMVVALFGFGLHYDNGQIHIRWTEVPAILVVFILAELGVHLVRRSREIGEKVDQSTQSAEKTLRASEKALAKSTEVVDRAEKLVDGFERMGTVAEMLASRFFDASIKLKERLPDKGRFWDRLGTFVSSWIPKGVRFHQYSGTLLEILFDAYTGKSEREGSVKEEHGSVKCITSDAVFSEASTRWLEKMLDDHKDQVVHVWAVSSLSPTEFALPELWLDPDGRRSSRSKALDEFIDQVIERCRKARDGHDRLEYRRVTVLEDAESLRYYLAPPAQVKHGQPSILADALDNWFIWDERLDSLGLDQDLVAEAAQFALGAGGTKVEESTTRNLSRDELEKIWGTRRGPGDIYRRKLLPSLTYETEHNRYYLRRVGKRDDNLRLVLGCPAAWLSKSIVNAKDLLDLELPQNIKQQLRTIQKTNGKTVRDLLKPLGWMSIRDWYCSALHTKEDQAWWAIKSSTDIESKFDDDFFEDFALQWNGTKVLTLDVLLIGSCKGESASDVQWYGAVVSNLRLDRTECTVELKMDSDKLQEVGRKIAMMCATGDRSGTWRELASAEQVPGLI